VRCREVCRRSVQQPLEGRADEQDDAVVVERDHRIEVARDHGADGLLRTGSRVRNSVLAPRRSDAITLEGYRLYRAAGTWSGPRRR